MNQLLELLYKSSLSWMLFLALSCFIAVSCFWSVLFWASSCTVEDEDTPIHLLVYSFAALTGLDILDHLGQRTEIRFDPLAGAAAVIDDGTFTLEVPPGTDVIGG